MENLNEQESDKLILAELNITDDNSTTNQPEEDETEESTTEEVVEETEEEETEEETETEESDDSEEEDETEEEPEEDEKKPNKFAKLLKQRNAARSKAEQATDQIQELQAKLDQLEADGEY